MKAAIAAGHAVTVPAAKTIADGIAVAPYRRSTPFRFAQKYVDEIVTVEEEEIANAILLLLEREKTLAEGAGAAAIAALLIKKVAIKEYPSAVLVCGGNIDVTLLRAHHRARAGERRPLAGCGLLYRTGRQPARASLAW